MVDHYPLVETPPTVNADGSVKARPSDGIRRELCTIVPACSYLFDASSSLDEIMGRVTDKGTLAALHALAVQLDSVRQHLCERTDEIEKYGTSGSLGAAVFSPMYGNERSQTGARSRLGEAMHSSLVSKRFSSIASTVARRDAKALAPAPSFRRSLAQMSDDSGRRGGGRRRSGGGGQGGGDSGSGGNGDRRAQAPAGERQPGGRGGKSGGRGKGGGKRTRSGGPREYAVAAVAMRPLQVHLYKSIKKKCICGFRSLVLRSAHVPYNTLRSGLHVHVLYTVRPCTALLYGA